MITANVHKAKTDLSKLIEAALNGEKVTIAKNNKPVVDIVKHETSKKKSSYGLLKGKVWVSDDFDDEDPEINKLFGVE